MDELILGLLQALFGHKLLFIELLARAEAGVFDLDVHVRLEAGEADQVARQGVDLHRGAHVEDEDLAPVGIGAGKHHEADGLGDGHEVADDIRMGDGDGAALGDLLLEEWDHRAVGAQDVSEADGDKLGLRIPKGLADSFASVGLVPKVSEELGQLVRVSGLDLGVEGLDNHLAEALRGAHDVGGVHGLVGGDEDKALTAVHHGGIGRFIAAEGVVLNGLAGAVLHEGDMLMGRSVIDDLRPVIGKNLEHPSAVADGADEGHKIQVREGVLQLVLDVIGVVFVDVKDDELFRMMGRDLAAELRADASAAARDEDGLAAYEVIDLLHLGADLVPAEKVLDRDILHDGDGDFSLGELGDAGHDLELGVRLLADVQDVAALLESGAGNGEVNLLDLILRHIFQDAFAAADHGDAVDKAAPLVRVVVHDADDLLLHVFHALDIAEDDLSGASGADEHDALVSVTEVLLMQEEDHAVGEADPGHEKELDQGAGEVVGHGHAVEEEGNSPCMQAGRHEGGQEYTDQLVKTRKTPDAVIQFEKDKDDQSNHGIGRREHTPGVVVGHGDIRKEAVIADPEGQEVRKAHGGGIVQSQEHGDNLPMLDQRSFVTGLFGHSNILTLPAPRRRRGTGRKCEK